VQRTLEEHYAFVLVYTHFLRDEGWEHMRAVFTSVPAIILPLVGSIVRGRMKKMLWQQGVLRHSHRDIIESALRDWRAVLRVMGDGPFFFGDEPTGVDAIVFGALATSVLTPIESPIQDFLRSQPACVAYVERMRARFFPELAAPSREGAAPAKGTSRAVEVGTSTEIFKG
jgi:glutathione S-transferase